jgi:hypothetical protein
MQREFLSVYHSRSTSGITSMALAVFIIVVGFILAIYNDGENRSYGEYFLFISFVGAGALLLGRFILDYRNAVEWEFRATKVDLTWIRRDKLEQRIEGVIAIGSIIALIYRTGDSDSGPYLELERADGLVELFPSYGGAWNVKQMRAFLEYWRETHPGLPIRNW